MPESDERFRVLLICDDPEEADLVRLLVEEGLAAREPRVERDGDGTDSPARAAGVRPDVVLVDSRVARGGISCVAALREEGYDGPVVFLADAHYPEEGPSAIRAGATVAVSKPSLTPQALAALVEQAIDVCRSARRATTAEREKHRSEALFQALFEASADLVLILDAELGIRLASPSSAMLLGVAPERLTGTSFAQHVEPEDLAGMRAWLASLAARPEAKVTTHDLRVRRSDGCRRLFEASGRNLLHDAPVQGFVVALRDITESDEAQQALRESERRYRLLFNAISDAIYVHEVGADGRLGNFLNVNEVAARRLGYAPEEMLRLSPHDIDDPTAAVDRTSVAEALRTGKSATFDQVHVTKDGRRIPVEINCHAFQLDGRTAVLSIVRDLSEQREARRALEAAQRRLEGVFEASPLPSFITDRSGRFLAVNRAFGEAFGYSREEMTTVPEWFEVAFPDPGYRAEMAAARLRRVEEARRTGHPTGVFLVRLRCRDGSKRWVEVIDSPLGEDTLVVFEDVSERWLAAEAVADSDLRLRALFDSAPIGIAISRGAVHLQVNPAFARMFGYPSPASVVGTSLGEQLAPGDRERMLAQNASREAGESPAPSFEAEGMRKDGTLFRLQVDVSRLELADGPATLAFLREVARADPPARAT